MALKFLQLLKFRNLPLIPSIARHRRAMDKVYVRSVEGEERLQVTFNYRFESGVEKTFNMNRSCDETLAVSLNRMRNNITSVLEKKNKKKKKKTEAVEDNQSEEKPIELEPLLYHNGEVVNNDVINSVAWKDGSLLSIGDQQYEIVVNSPTVRKIELSSSLVVGFPATPRIDLEFAHPNMCIYTWYKGYCSDTPETSKTKANKNPPIPVKEWTQLEESFLYMPTNLDIGAYLKVVCQPVSPDKVGVPVEAVSKTTVGASPGYCPFETRHNFTTKPVGKEG